MQKLIDESMMDICKEEGVSPEQVFFAGLCCWFYRYELNINFLCAKDSLWKYKGLFLVLIKKQKQKETKKKNSCKIFWRWNFKRVTQKDLILLGSLRVK